MKIRFVPDVVHTTNDGDEIIGDVSRVELPEYIVETVIWHEEGTVFHETIVFDRREDEVTKRGESRLFPLSVKNPNIG